MIRMIQKLVMGISIISSFSVTLSDASPPPTLPGLTYGTQSAPIHMIEFSSLTCPHCAIFHQKTLPYVIQKYTNTGQLYLTCRDYPDNELAMNATLLIHCAKSPQDALKMRELLFETQSRWLMHPRPWETLSKIVKPFLPISPEACISNPDLFKKIMDRVMDDYHRYKITHTPSFVVGNKVYPKALTAQELDTILDGGDPKIATMRTLEMKQPGKPRP